MDIRLTAPFPIGDLPADLIDPEGKRARITLRNGRWQGDASGALRLQLVDEPDASGSAEGDGAGDAEPTGSVVSVEQLFREGVAVPADGKLQVAWALPCLAEPEMQTHEGKRFGSFEHIRCADFAGLDRVAEDARPLVIGGVDVGFGPQTLLTVGQSQLTFGEIICLAGDFYAALDDTAAAALPWAWPKADGLAGWLGGDYRATTLRDDDAKNVRELIAVIKRDGDERRSSAAELLTAINDKARHRYPLRRYLALASQNHCHFACPHPGWNADASEALRLYDAYHARALDEAAAARTAPGDRRNRLFAALATDAFACHFLTDSFASGHMRVPRRLLAQQFGVLRGSLRMSKAMHDEENAQGLWCRSLLPQHGRRVVWRAYGDGYLGSEEARLNRMQVQDAVRRSVAELLYRYAGRDVVAEERARALVPVPLAPGQRPGDEDRLPDGKRPPATTLGNHWPLYWFDAEGRILKRRGGLDESDYQRVGGGPAEPAAVTW